MLCAAIGNAPRGRRAGDEAARPGPVKVVPAARGVDVERLARGEQARIEPRFHRARIERLDGEPPAQHLALPLVADALDGQGELREGPFQRGQIIRIEQGMGIQARLFQHRVADLGQQKPPQQRLVGDRRARSAAEPLRRGKPPRAFDEVPPEACPLHLGKEIDEQRIARLGEARQVEDADPRHAVRAEQHLAAFLRLRHPERGVVGQSHARPHADVVEPARRLLAHTQRAEHRAGRF